MKATSYAIFFEDEDGDFTEHIRFDAPNVLDARKIYQSVRETTAPEAIVHLCLKDRKGWEIILP